MPDGACDAGDSSGRLQVPSGVWRVVARGDSELPFMFVEHACGKPVALHQQSRTDGVSREAARV